MYSCFEERLPRLSATLLSCTHFYIVQEPASLKILLPLYSFSAISGACSC
jgi:hypothetical protein